MAVQASERQGSLKLRSDTKFKSRCLHPPGDADAQQRSGHGALIRPIAHMLDDGVGTHQRRSSCRHGRRDCAHRRVRFVQASARPAVSAESRCKFFGKSSVSKRTARRDPSRQCCAVSSGRRYQRSRYRGPASWQGLRSVALSRWPLACRQEPFRSLTRPLTRRRRRARGDPG